MNKHMKADTALGAALERVGVVPRSARFNVEIAWFLNQGGTFAEMRALIDAAERMSGEGRRTVASDGQPLSAPARQPVEDVRGHGLSASNGLGEPAPPSSSNRGGSGPSKTANHSIHAGIVREPTQQQRSAMQSVNKIAAITIMDTLRIDGRPIGDWTVAEARRAGKMKTREGHILLAASRMVANAVGHESLRAVVKPAEMQKIIQKAAEVSDAA